MTDHENNNYQQPYPNMPQDPDMPHNPDIPPVMKKNKNRYASTALMFGIFSIVNLCGFMFPMAIIMGVSAACFAVLSKNRQELPENGQEAPMTTAARVGLIAGVIAAVLGVAEYFVMLNVYDMMKDPELIPYFNDAFDKLREYMNQNML